MYVSVTLALVIHIMDFCISNDTYDPHQCYSCHSKLAALKVLKESTADVNE
jgi:hypothetical protein